MIGVILKRSLVYTGLVLGAIVFAVPFVWLATTSIKTDRELFSRKLTILPASPEPKLQSPYVDTRYYEDLDGPHVKELVENFTAIIPQTGFKFPADVDSRAAGEQTARGLYERMRSVLPSSIWNGTIEEITAAAKKRIDKNMVAGIFNSVYRRLIFGRIRLRTLALTEDVVSAGELEPKTPDMVHLSRCTDTGGWTCMLYDFYKKDRWIVSKTYTTKFDVKDLYRIQLDLRPDETWHELWLSVEKMGVRYISDRPVPLVGFSWIAVTWQEPSPDDESTKIKTWNLLKPTARSAKFINDPHQLKITFELRKTTPFQAWIQKTKLNYERVLRYIPFWRYIRISLFLVLANVVLTMFSCSLVAYAFARLQWPGRNICFLLMLATLMIPSQVTMIPNFLIWRYLGAYNTLTPLWLPSIFGVPFFIFLLRQFMLGIPKDLEDAARIDGCGFLRIYWYIIIPLIRPSLTAIAIFTFMATWNDFIGPLIYISDQRLYPLAFGLFAFSVESDNNPALTMAASLLMTLPVILIFFFTQRYFIQGITMSGIKG